MDYIRDPRLIEQNSMAIVDRFLAGCSFDPVQLPVVRRMIHATGDFDIAGAVAFGPGAVAGGGQALKRGGPVFCDTEMVKAGLNRRLLSGLGLFPVCLIHDPGVARRAEASGITRAAAAVAVYMERCPEGRVFVIGNAPTALFSLLEAVEAKVIQPALVVGTPVGFVGAAEAKQALTSFTFPWITALGRKGGSAVAAAAFNAMLYLASADGVGRV